MSPLPSTAPPVPPARTQLRVFSGSLTLALFFAIGLLVVPIGGPSPSLGQSGGSGGGGGYIYIGGSYSCPCSEVMGMGAPAAGDPVSLGNGALLFSQTDLGVGGPVPLALGRYHRTLDYSAGPWGPGSSSSFDWFVVDVGTFYFGHPPGGGYELILPLNRHARFEEQALDPAQPIYASTGGSNMSFSYYWKSAEPEFAGWKLYAGGYNEAVLVSPDGTLRHFKSGGGLVRVRNRLGVGIDISRNANQYATAVTNTQNSYSISIQYGTNGMASSATDHTGRQVQYFYDSAGLLSEVRDVAARSSFYHWVLNPYGGYTSYGLWKVVDPRGAPILTNTFNSSGQVASQQLGNGGVWNFEYFPGPGTQTTKVWDANGNLTIYELARYGYSYYPTAVTSPLGRRTTYSYTSGVPFLASVTDFRGRTVSYDWNQATGKLLAAHRPKAGGGVATTGFTYDPNRYHELVSYTDELNQTGAITLNNQGLPERIAAPYGADAEFLYNQAGQPTRITSPAGGVTDVVYNSVGLPSVITNALTQATSLGWNGRGRLIAVIDPLSRSVSYGVNAIGRLASVTGPQTNGVTSGFALAYNNASAVTGLSAAGGASHSWTVDGANRTSSGTDAAGATETVTRDGNGNARVIVDRKGQRIEITLGTGDRPTQVAYKRADGSIESTVTYTYSPTTDLLTGINDSAGPDYTLGHNSLDQLVSLTGPEGTTTLTRDDLGRVTAAQAPGQAAVTFGYDAYGRLQSVSRGSQTLTYQWDNITGHLLSVTRPNGIVTTYSRDLLERVTGIEHRKNGVLLEEETYGFDAGGRVTSRTRNGAGSTFSHNNLDELTGYSVPGQAATLGYDVAGNRTSQTINGVAKSLAYNVANRLTSDGGASVVHDANGNIVQHGSWTYSWDVRGRLVQAQGPGVNAVFEYDCFNRRVAKTVNGTTTRFIWLGNDLAAETDASWNVSASYFYRPGVDLPISRTAGGQTVYYLQDLGGSVTALADGSGAILGRYSYSPWGETVSQGAGLPSQPLKWTGRERDETGLYYLRGRYYNPQLGRFLSEDPAGFAANLNLYVFALNSPVGVSDPFGLDPNGGMGDFFNSWGDMFKSAWKNFRNSPMFSPGSPERQQFSNAMGGIPGVGDGLSFFTGLTGYDPIAGTNVSPAEQAMAMAGALPLIPGVVGKAARAECFPAGTPVATRAGDKPIERIRPGDEVFSADPATGKQSYQKVVRTFVRQADMLLKIVTADGRTVEATLEHPFWVKGKGFVAAKKLARSDLLKDRYGRYVAVARVTRRRGRVSVYNFEVERTHTYYAGGWFVHNTCPKSPLDDTPFARHPTSRPLTADVEPGEYVYVRDVNGVVHIARNGPHMHPQVLGGAQQATGAGTITIGPGGVVTAIDNLSGTFQFPRDSIGDVAKSVEQQGLTVPPSAIRPGWGW